MIVLVAETVPHLMARLPHPPELCGPDGLPIPDEDTTTTVESEHPVRCLTLCSRCVPHPDKLAFRPQIPTWDLIDGRK